MTTQTDVREAVARETLAREWGDHPQWSEVVRRIRDGSCEIHSDPVSLANTIALRAILSTLLNRDEEVERLREAHDTCHYLMGLYRRLWQGGVVRDLAEAEAAYNSAADRARAALTHGEKNRG